MRRRGEGQTLTLSNPTFLFLSLIKNRVRPQSVLRAGQLSKLGCSAIDHALSDDNMVFPKVRVLKTWEKFARVVDKM